MRTPTSIRSGHRRQEPEPNGAIGPGLWFLLAFVACAVARDVTYEFSLSDSIDGLNFALLVCLSVVSVSALWLIGTHQFADLLFRLRPGPVLARALFLGPMTAMVYSVTFSLIAPDKLGAGLFNLVDGGLTPILTTSIGVFVWRESLNRQFIFAFSIYLVGIWALFGGQSSRDALPLLATAVLSPIGTAASYGLQKWLLEPDRGGLTPSQVLFVRFFPASITIWIYATYIGADVTGFNALHLALPAALGLGVSPVVLLCWALTRNSLKRFSTWFFLIPAGTYLLTLQLHPENQRALPVAGAALIILCIVVMEGIGKTGSQRSTAGQLKSQ